MVNDKQSHSLIYIHSFKSLKNFDFSNAKDIPHVQFNSNTIEVYFQCVVNWQIVFMPKSVENQKKIKNTQKNRVHFL